MDDRLSIAITTLTPPTGRHNTYAYGYTAGGGYVYLSEMDDQFAIEYMPPTELFPADGDESVIFREENPDTSLFTAAPYELDAITPDNITVPTEYRELSQSEQRAMRAVWHGVQSGNEPRDPAAVPNISHLTSEMALGDTEWQLLQECDAMVLAAEEGFERQSTVFQRLGAPYYMAVVNDNQTARVGMIRDQPDLFRDNLCGSPNNFVG